MNTHHGITPESAHHSLLSAAFNQDQGCFAISHEAGFRVYSTDPMELKVKRDFGDGGIGIAKMLHRTNYLALVGGGKNPKFPQNKVVIWDDLKHRPTLSLDFLSPVLNVLLSRTHIVVVLKNKVHLYAFSSPPTRIAVYETVDNPDGIAELAGSVLAFPGRSEGQVQFVSLSTDPGDHRNLVSIVRAHRAPIRCLTLSANGTLCASASDQGTIIRLHSTQNTALLHEFRRGLDRAIIYSMAFSRSSNRLAVVSDKNTVHVFDATPALSSTNRRHVLSKVPLLPSYFSSEWSFASARVTGTRAIVGWSSEDSIILVWTSDKCKWEKYDIVERESTSPTPEMRWELVREAWRGFEGLSYD